MRIFQIILICIPLLGVLQAQTTIPEDSPIVGTWTLIAPKDSPGPEFIPESYKGINNFTLYAGKNESEASGSGKDHNYSLNFMAEWDGKKLTGKLTKASWTTDFAQLKISVPLEYDLNNKKIVIHMNNPEYGDVKFIFQKMKW